MNLTTLRLLGMLACLMVLWGCQSDIALSRAVRVGDTIAVSLGNADPSDVSDTTPANVTKPLLKKSDITTATIHSDSSPSNKYNVKIRYVFRAFADLTASVPLYRGKAMWIAILDLANSSGTPVPLSPGAATLTFNSAHFKAPHTVKLDILPTQGTPHPFLSKQLPQVVDKFALIEPAKQARVHITGSLPSQRKLGAAKYVFDIPHIDGTNILGQPIAAVAPARFPSIEQINFRVVKDSSIMYGSSGTLVSIYLTAAEGLSETQLNRFDFVMTSELSAVNGVSSYWDDHYVSSEFYDTNGDAIEPAFLDYNVGLIE